jgi:hypothetical protein
MSYRPSPLESVLAHALQRHYQVVLLDQFGWNWWRHRWAEDVNDAMDQVIDLLSTKTSAKPAQLLRAAERRVYKTDLLQRYKAIRHFTSTFLSQLNGRPVALLVDADLPFWQQVHAVVANAPL